MPMRRLNILLGAIGVLLSTSAAFAQGIPIGALPNATLPLSGSEYTILSQNGTTVKATVNAVAAPALTIPNNTMLGNITGATAQATALTATQIRTLLGLGTAALQNIGTSGSNVPLLSNANTWAGLQTFSGGVVISGTVTLSALNVTGTTQLGTGTASPLIVTATGISANLASGAGSIELKPSNAQVNVTGALATSTTATIGTGLTVSAGGAAITGNTSVTAGSFTASPANANVVLSPTGTGLVTINPATTGSIANVTGSFTTLTASGTVTLSPANAAVTLSPTGTGVVTINPTAAGTLNNMVIGGSTPLAITGTTITAGTAFRGTDFGSGSASTVNLTTTGGTQFQILNTATAARNITVTGSNAGNPTLSVTAGSLAVTPATVFASTISATGITNTAGETFSGASAPITLNASAGTSGNVLTSAGPGATPTWTSLSAVYPAWGGIKTTAFNAVSGTAYCVDTQTTGAVTMTLPASPADGDQIRFIDCKSNFAVANLTVARNAKSIMGLASDMTVNTPNAASTMVYVSANSDWRMY